MQCSKCGNSQVIIKKQQSGQYLCKDCFIESIEKKVIKTVKNEKEMSIAVSAERQRNNADEGGNLNYFFSNT